MHIAVLDLLLKCSGRRPAERCSMLDRGGHPRDRVHSMLNQRACLLLINNGWQGLLAARRSHVLESGMESFTLALIMIRLAAIVRQHYGAMREGFHASLWVLYGQRPASRRRRWGAKAATARRRNRRLSCHQRPLASCNGRLISSQVLGPPPIPLVRISLATKCQR